MNLTLPDWIIIIAYLIGCLAAGLWMRKFVRGVEDFAVAGREMDVNLGIASLAATEPVFLYHPYQLVLVSRQFEI